MSDCKASARIMHLVRKMNEDVTDIKTVEVRVEFFDKTVIRHLMVGTGETSWRNERVHVLQENFAECRCEGTRYSGDGNIYSHGAMKYLTNLRDHMTFNLECFLIRSIFALHRGLSCQGIWASIDGITNDRQHKDETEFVGEMASHRRKNKDSVIRAAIQEHRAVLGLANPAEKISALKKDKERYYRLMLRYFVFLDRELERKAEMKLREERNGEWKRRKAALMGKRFNVVPLWNIKPHFVTIDSRILHGIMRETSPEVNASRGEFSGENRETYWKNILDFKLLNTCKQKVFTRMIETGEVSKCVHYRRLEADRRVPPSAAAVTKRGDEKEAYLATQDVEDNDFVIGTNPGNTNIVTIAAPKRAEVANNGNLRQKDMRLLRFS